MMSHEEKTIDDILRDIAESDKVVDESIASLKKLELDSAFDDGRREGRKLGFKYAISVLQNRVEEMEKWQDKYKADGMDLRRFGYSREIPIYKEIIESLEKFKEN